MERKSTGSQDCCNNEKKLTETLHQFNQELPWFPSFGDQEKKEQTIILTIKLKNKQETRKKNYHPKDLHELTKKVMSNFTEK